MGTFHPAVPTLRELAQRRWVRVIVLPEEAGEENNELIALSQKFGLPSTYDLSEIEQYPVNLVLAANYPKMVSSRYLEKYPCINTHWSALPRYRGVHGTAWALLNQEYTIAFTVHWMEKEFDTGHILAQGFVRMEPDMNIIDLHTRLAEQQAECVVNVLEQYLETGEWRQQAQCHRQATYVPQRVPEDGIIDWRWPTERVWNLVRALPAPMYPGAFTFRDNEKLIIWQAQPAACPPYFCTPGQVVRVRRGKGVWVKTGDTCLEVHQVEVEGSAEGPQRADKVLRRGEKLGYNPQLEISQLRHQVNELSEQVNQLRQALEDANA